MELEYPERFISQAPKAPSVKWLGSIAELLELAIPVFCAGKIAKPTGEPMAYSDVVALIEEIFGITVSRPYERKTKLFNRKKSETPFLNKLITIFRLEVEKSNL